MRKIIYETDLLEPIVIAIDLMRPVQQYFTSEDTLDNVIIAFSQMNIDELPVVNNEIEQCLIGIVSKNDVINVYNKEIFKRDTVTSVSSYISSLRRFNKIEMANGNVLCEFEVPGTFIESSLKKLNLRSRFGVEVILIKQNYDPKRKEWGNIITPSPDYRFRFGDAILAMGSQENIDKLRSMN